MCVCVSGIQDYETLKDVVRVGTCNGNAGGGE